MTNTVDITLWLVGVTPEDAQAQFPFDSEESAQSCADDNPGTRLFTVTATIDLSTIAPADSASPAKRR